VCRLPLCSPKNAAATPEKTQKCRPGFCGRKIESYFALIKHRADVIVANRMTPELVDVMDKVYTRDLFGAD
jgi:hypothetical protein